MLVRKPDPNSVNEYAHRLVRKGHGTLSRKYRRWCQYADRVCLREVEARYRRLLRSNAVAE